MPHWRKIEAALIDLLPEWGYELGYERGETYVHVNGVELTVSEIAKELEKRL